MRHGKEARTDERDQRRREAEADERERVLLVSSSGGHLLQLHRLEPWWRKHERLWVTFDTPDATSLLGDERAVWAHRPTTRNLRNLARNAVLAARVLAAFEPTVIVSTGAALAFPFFVLARIRGVRTVYVEVYDRIDLPTLTGRLCYPLSNLFLIQWDDQRRFYKRSELIGRLL